MATVDVTILGAGVIGHSCALACLKRGASVRIHDPHGPAAGASGGVVGALAPHPPDNWNPKKQFQFDSLIMARDFWPWVEQVSGKPTGYRPTGRLQPVLTEKQLPHAHKRTLGAQDLWGDQAKWDVIQSTGADWEPPSPMGWIIHDTLSAHLHPRQATLAMAAAALELGAQFSDQVQGAVIDARGWAGLQALNMAVGAEVGNGVKGQAALLRPEWAGDEQIFADGIHIVPHTDGTVAIGSTSERVFSDPTTVDHQLDDIITRAKTFMPTLAQAPVIERWAGVRPRAISRAPIMGKHPTKDGWFMANGGFKIGFGMAPKMGECMADLVLDQVNTIPYDFRIEALF